MLTSIKKKKKKKTLQKAKKNVWLRTFVVNLGLEGIAEHMSETTEYSGHKSNDTDRISAVPSGHLLYCSLDGSTTDGYKNIEIQWR